MLSGKVGFQQFEPHAPDSMQRPYVPASGLTKFQQQVLEMLDYETPRRAISLGLGDARGVGASLAALAYRGYVEGDGKRGYIRRRRVQPEMVTYRVMYRCSGCQRGFHPAEVDVDMSQHVSFPGIPACHDVRLIPFDKGY